MAADLFCGAGGSSTGLVRAAEARGVQLDLLAVNHWSVAVATHTKNHPWAKHLCADLGCVDPSKVVPGGKLDLLIASPECTHFSTARGGKPCSDQSRASAWHVLHWAERLQVQEILIENVKEFLTWGPLNKKTMRPDKTKSGVTFRAFVGALESMGYVVEHRILNAADYGDATCRKRLFVRASKTGRIRWPEASHVGRWRAAAEVIDWDLKGESIFKRKRPLKDATLRRIEAGLKKFGGEPFIAVLRGTNMSQEGSCAKAMSDPLQTISAGGIHAAICEPFLVEYHGEKDEEGDGRAKSVREPLPAQTTENRFGLCRPFIVPMEHSGRQGPRDVEKPLATITTARGGAFGLCQPFVIGQQSGSVARSTGEPLPTIATAGAIALCQPFLTKYYGTGCGAHPVTEPMDTITAKDRFALVEPGRMDILFRMLQPHELAKAMGFDGYELAGTKTDQVRQIGNAVAVRTAQALCGCVIDAGVVARNKK